MKVRVQDPRGLEAHISLSQVDNLASTVGLSEFLGAFHLAKPLPSECPHCGWTDDQYLQSGYVGCPLCYSSLSAVAESEGT